MSFRCDTCGRALKDGQAPVFIVAQRRLRVYPPVFEDGKLKFKGGEGWEIVKEIKVCRPCAKTEPVSEE